MAVNEVLLSIAGRIQLNNGTTASGGIRTKAVSVGKLNPAAWDVGKYWAIAQALSPVFDKTTYYTDNVKTYQVTNS